MKNKYLNLKKLDNKQREHVLNILPEFLDVLDTHYCLIEMESSYVLSSLDYVSFREFEEVDYFSFGSVFSATPLEAEIVVEESTADNLLREVVNQYPDIISGDFSAFAFRSLVDEIRDYLKRK